VEDLAALAQSPYPTIVTAIVWIVSEAGNRGGGRVGPAVSAREILDQRLARGEIAPEQYDQLREKLDATSAPSDPRPANPAGVSAGDTGGVEVWVEPPLVWGRPTLDSAHVVIVDVVPGFHGCTQAAMMQSSNVWRVPPHHLAALTC
jgi:hypothetical protein